MRRLSPAQQKRYDIVYDKLKPLQGKKFFCPCLGCDVSFTAKSISEMANHAVYSDLNKDAALCIVKQLKLAKFVKSHSPKPTQKNKYKFFRMYELRGVYKSHPTKIMVARHSKGFRVQYSLTIAK